MGNGYLSGISSLSQRMYLGFSSGWVSTGPISML
jgi:hypothetical protein